MQIHERVHLVASGAYGFDLSHPSDCHVYLVDGGSEWALIDAGAGVDEGALSHSLRERGFPVDRIRHLFVTHAHADHSMHYPATSQANRWTAWMPSSIVSNSSGRTRTP